MTNISFTAGAWEDYLYWQQHDKQKLKKIFAGYFFYKFFSDNNNN